MCCSLDQIDGKLIIHTVNYENNGKNTEKTLQLKGVFDRTPKTLSERISRYFLNVELLEKIAEIADEFFHLLGSTFQRYTSLMVYQTLRHLHHASHDIEHVLHSFCFLGDIASIFNGKFIKYQGHGSKKIDYLRTLSRVCHTTSHFLASAQFLYELKVNSLNRLEKYFKYSVALSTLGYSLWTVSLLWDRYKGKPNDEFGSQMGIHLGGSVFEGLHFANRFRAAAPYAAIINKGAALAGIVHAWFVVKHLMPKDQEAFVVQLPLPKESNGDVQHKSHNHAHDSSCQHS